jgi:hypothetical protein
MDLVVVVAFSLQIADDRVRSKAHEELTSAGQASRHSTRFETALHPMD